MTRTRQGPKQPVVPRLSGPRGLVPEVVIRLGHHSTPPPVSMPMPTRSSRNAPSDRSPRSDPPGTNSRVSKRLTSKPKPATTHTKPRSKAGKKDLMASKFAAHAVTSGRDGAGYSRNGSPSLSSTSYGDIHSTLHTPNLQPSRPVVNLGSNPLQSPLMKSKKAISSNQSAAIPLPSSKSAMPPPERTKDYGVDGEDLQTFWGDDNAAVDATLGIENSGSDDDADWDPAIPTGGEDVNHGEDFDDTNRVKDLDMRPGKEPNPARSIAKKPSSPGPHGQGGRFSQAQLKEVERHARLFRDAMAGLAKSWGCHTSTLYRVAKVAGALTKRRRPNAWNSFQHQQKKLKKTPSGPGVQI
jgi:hypothetical protein